MELRRLHASLGSLLLPISIILCFMSISTADDEPWCYSSNDCSQESYTSRWQTGECKSGKNQSPINIEPDNIVDKSPEKGTLKDGNVIFKGKQRKNYDITEFTLSNANNTIQLYNFTTASGKDPVFEWEGSKYKLDRVHFHWGNTDESGSEHAINGTFASAEIHMVHFKLGTNDSDKGYVSLNSAIASGKADSVAVISLLLQSQEEEDEDKENKKDSRRKRAAILESLTKLLIKGKHKAKDHFNSTTFLEPIISSLDKLNDTDSARVWRTVKFSDLLRPQKVFTYMGSLTTPGCNEVVAWVICDKVLKVNQSHVQSLRAAGREVGGGSLPSNCRKLQDNKLPDGTKRPVKRISIEES